MAQIKRNSSNTYVLIISEQVDTFDGVVISPSGIGVYRQNLSVKDFNDVVGDYTIVGGEWYKSIEEGKIYLLLKGRLRENLNSVLIFNQNGVKWDFHKFVEFESSVLKDRQIHLDEVTITGDKHA